MRFIRGDSLQEAIARFHRADGPGRDPGERALALRQLLGRFVDVCDAIAYAHSRGVLHRDLKPGNIMLGQYGETLVVDWGLAKAVGRAAGDGGAAEGPLQPASASGPAATQVGSALGTPQYMSPEQAAGRLDQLGPSSDVYSLGATLYCLLTGKAPFEGRDVGEVLRQVQRGEFPPPRQVQRAVPPALEAVCLKAMALRPEGRYATPRALVADVEKWLADEPVSAWREPLRLRAGRWARRHQAAVAACVAGLLVAVLAGGAGAWWLDRQRSEQRRAVQATLDKVGELQEKGQWKEAEVLLEREDERLGPRGPHDLKARLKRAADELALVKRLEDIRLKRAILVEGRMDTAGADRDYAVEFRAAGLGEVGSDAATAAAWVRNSPVHKALLAALYDWGSHASGRQRRAWLLGVARLADPWWDGVRDPAAWKDAAVLARRVQGEPAAQQSPQLLLMVGMRLRGKEREALLKWAWEGHPEDLWLNFELANALKEGKKPEEAVSYFRAALAVRPGTAVVHNNLGNALRKQHKVAEAIAEYKKAIELDPKSATAHYNVGAALGHQGKLAEAIAEYKKAIELDPKYAAPHSNLGNALRKQHKVAEAIAEHKKAIELDPKDASAHTNLGVALADQGKWAEAIAEFKKAIELDPKFATAHTNLGSALYAQGKLAEAIAECKKAIELDPKDATPHNSLGGVLRDQHKFAEAIAEFQKAIELDPKCAPAHSNLGLALRRQNKVEEAIAAVRKAIELDPKDAHAHVALGQILLEQGHLTEARQATQRCLDLLPANHPLRAFASELLRQCEQMQALDQKLGAVLQGKSRTADAAEQVSLAGLCLLKKRYTDATRFFAGAFKAQPQLADDLQAGHRYNAACAAALAAAGQGGDAARLDDKDRASLRQQALGWLRADLALWGKQAERGTPQTRAAVQKTLQHWQEDADLARLRDAAALAKLPEAERAEWQKLWADVEATLNKAGKGEKK
jgi:tetratricopeptide (TPR) repeat protein